ncbi:MAG: hypothetical protein CMH52_06365 [Myxococcales bacterium]|nr:hypothetical protein [Myxococcales bacterium]
MSKEFDEEGFVAGSFDPVKVYDAPMVALSQMFEGEASFRSLRDTLMDPASLSPAERDSYVSRLKESLGNNPLSNAFLDIALNPFVWLMFVTSPAAGKALKATGEVFTGKMARKVSEGKEYFEYVTGNYTPLASLGLLNAHQLGAGTPLPSILESAATRIKTLTTRDIMVELPAKKEALEKISAKFGVRVNSFDPDEAGNAFATINGESVSLKEYLKKFNIYAYVQSAGLNKDVVRKNVIVGQNVKLMLFSGGKDVSYTLTPRQAEALSKFNADEILLRQKINKAREAGELEEASLLISNLRKNFSSKKDYLKNNVGVTEDIDSAKRLVMSPIRDSVLPYPDDIPLRPFVEAKKISAIDPEDISGRWLRREGLMPLLNQRRDLMKARYVEMFGDVKTFERTGELKYDDNKLLRIFRSLSSGLAGKSAEEISSVLSKEFQGSVGPDGYRKILKAMTPDADDLQKMTLDEFKDILRTVRSESDDLDNYMPRNVWTYVEDGGNIRNPTNSIRVSKENRAADLSGRASERQSLDNPIFDSQDLAVLKDDYAARGLSSSELDDAFRRSRNYEIEVVPTKENAIGQVMNLDYDQSYSRYMKQTRNDVVLHIDDAAKDAFILRAKGLPSWNQMLKSARPGAERIAERNILGGVDAGRTRYDYLRFASDAIAGVPDRTRRRGGERTSEYIMGTLVNRMRGAVPLRDVLSEEISIKAMDAAKAMADSKAFRALERAGGIPASFVQSLRRYGDMTLDEAGGGGVGRGLTTLFYGSHLGFNLGSAVLNLMQPLMYAAAWMDPDVMIKAYGQGLKQYFGYIGERIKMPLRADALEVEELRKKHFRLSNVANSEAPGGVDLLDIRKTDFELIDSEMHKADIGLDRTRGGFASGVRFWGSEVPMKLFTQSELFNRVVTGEAMLGQLIKSGRAGSLKRSPTGAYQVVGGKSEFADIEVASNVRQMVQNTQFGSDLINSPQLFQNSGFGIPWVRQFFSFPVRTLTTLTDTTPMVNNGRRTWGVLGFKTENAMAARLHDLSRMMGTSAILYEAGKNLAGVDLSRGLAGQALFESTIVGPVLTAPDSEVAYALPMPPAVSVIKDASQAIMDEDTSIIGTLAPRFVPGGIALSRFLNALPRVADPKGFFGGLQRESADWGNMNPQGQVPIYRKDGSLLEYRSAARTILGGLGFNSYMFRTDQELNAFLVKNRQGIINERRKYMDAMLANNMSKAAKIKANFEKRFKFPLSVSKVQVERALQLREVPLKERMYQRLQPEFRPIARPYLEERLETLKSRTPEELDLSTAEKARVLPSTFDTFDPFAAVTD